MVSEQNLTKKAIVVMVAVVCSQGMFWFHNADVFKYNDPSNMRRVITIDLLYITESVVSHTIVRLTYIQP
jgi:hypothetical protein